MEPGHPAISRVVRRVSVKTYSSHRAMAGSQAPVLKGATTRTLVAAPVVTGAFLFFTGKSYSRGRGGGGGERDCPAYGVDEGCFGDEPRSTQSIPLAFGFYQSEYAK